MLSDIQIIPVILAATEDEYQDKIKKIQNQKMDWVQIDLMDNKFVQNTSIGTDIIAKYPTGLKKEAHLMVDNPIRWIDKLVATGIKRIIFPIEVGETNKIIEQIRSANLQVGISLNPKTPVAKVEPFIGKIDLVLLMSVEPGFGGQKFILGTLEKIRRLAKLKNKNNNFLIEIDGGINEGNIREIIGAGADNLVIGERLIYGDIEENLEKIWEAARS